MNKYIIISILVLVLFGGCTKDDICSEETPATPLLVIDFKDITDRLSEKEVANLKILVNNIDSTQVIDVGSYTSVSIPLDTENNTTSFIFIKNSTSEDLINVDTIDFNYTTELVYVNRACAFKTIYTDFSVDIENEPLNENWMIDFTIENTTIENENEAHLTIFH